MQLKEWSRLGKRDKIGSSYADPVISVSQVANVYLQIATYGSRNAVHISFFILQIRLHDDPTGPRNLRLSAFAGKASSSCYKEMWVGHFLS